MARTLTEIENEIVTEKAKYTELNGLNSVSQTAIWRLWAKLTAFLINQLEKIFDAFSGEVNTTIENAKAGNVFWYIEKAKEFQNGDVLNSLGEYDTIDTSKQIITRCAVIDANPLIIKVAKSEPPTPLSTSEVTNFTTYINKVKFAGVQTNVVNLSADVVLVDIEVLYSEISEATALSTVKTAITGYIKNLAFDGDFVVNDMIAYCRTKTGILDVLVTEINIQGTAVAGGRRTAISGYFSFDSEAGGNNYVMTLV